ncbi:MAG: hypothetical protein ABSA78_16135 [Candidatus Sulfotelmatobacter sp.]|jgi:hypothetical protein
MKRVYLDSNVLIAYHSLDKAEETKKKTVEDALAVPAQGHSALYVNVGSN